MVATDEYRPLPEKWGGGGGRMVKMEKNGGEGEEMGDGGVGSEEKLMLMVKKEWGFGL